LSKWELVFQLVGVLAAVRAMESQFLCLAWGLVFAGKRELKEHSLIMWSHYNIYHPYLTGFSPMERAELLVYSHSRVERA
jgi:hypothetical protein